MMKKQVFTVISLILASVATAEEPPVDKSEFNLFNPTPREMWREMSADRPDATESPITVDAGVVQIEASFAEYTHDSYNHADETVDAWEILATNAKVGLTHDTDVQFVFSAYSEEKVNPDGARSKTVNGFGDVQIRLKHNLWGNDSGETALGVMPYIKLPVETELSNGKVEGGVIVMFGMDLSDTTGLGLQVEFGGVYDEDDDSYDLEFSHTAVLGADLIGPLGGYLEYLGIVSSDADTEYQAILSTGLTLAVSSDVVFDVGTRIGLNKEAEDVTVFGGVTFRF